jgi:hypothetical protein
MSTDESLKEIGARAAASIVEMVAALECDYDRLEELREDSPNDYTEIAELKELNEAAGEFTSRADVETRIQEDALSVEVRTDWEPVDVYSKGVASSAVEFRILLPTGGPASRIRGELSNGEPDRAWLEVQDWGTPWVRYHDIAQETLLTYARLFYYGES